MGLVLPDLPIRAALPRITSALARAGSLVLVAPPGTGKTTVVPLALASDVGKVVVAEPRRLAARAAARRMASLLGERVGGRVGFTVRGERRVSAATQIEVVTTGVLVRRLQRDPELAGTATVILDECHERHLDSDLALAFLTEVRAALRPDLQLLATSATADSDRLAEVLGAPVVTAEAPMFPVEVVWSPPPGPIAPPLGLRVDPRLLDHVASVARRALADGDVLVFLPGAREIDAVAGRLSGLNVIPLHGRQPGSIQDAALRPSDRRRIVLATAVAESSLTVPGVRAVVDAGLSRVPRMDHARGLGALVTVPVSRASATQRAGRAGREAPGRVYRCWPEAQHDRLPAQPEPEIATADLTGFALDLALWGHPDGTGLALPDQPPAGALRAAVTTLHDLGAVDASGRITPRGRALADAGLHPRLARALLDGATLVGPRRAAEIVALLDDDRNAPDDLPAAWRRARTTNDQAWRSETRRLTAALTRSPTDESTPAATDAAEDALTPDDDPDPPPSAPATPEPSRPARPPGPAHPIGPAQPARPAQQRGSAQPAKPGQPMEAAQQAVSAQQAMSAQPTGPAQPTRPAQPSGVGRPAGGGGRPSRAAGDGRRDAAGGGWLTDDLAAGMVVGLAYPERVARVREPGSRSYLMAGGTAAELPAGSGLAGVAWLAVASADRTAGAPTARIRAAAPLDEGAAREAAATLLVTETEIAWRDGDVVARTVERLGAITLVERRLAEPDPARLQAALLDGLRREGLALLSWSRNATELRERLAFARAALGDPWPDVSDQALLDQADGWLDLSRARRRSDLAKVDVIAALRRLLPWSVAGRLDEVAPERLPVPSGSRVRVDYTDPESPVLAVKVQEAFGWRDAPRLADGRVPVLLHLLSPAGRPVAVTRDLASFWVQGYPQVRAELRGRYPRHPWPEDPTTAAPTRRTNPRSR
ncbi:ATP-dependent helicase C-terminal domain-containing protein [Actinoplanes sp. NPDC051343]|uniref:ATP-dependent RNA helicase n=1 Tax=Actinoplanes sp. NPDC051343 TaxID=3363906 RepID=UPI0037912734